ncbi:MAG: hypothetical protein KDH96_04910 [Candidatus Riesia sp.]|nr:hypothetical protein [Candidatus Riesia sp.]
MTSNTLNWLAGLLEGEGCFIPQTEKYPMCISLHMTDLDIIEKVCNLFDVSFCKTKKQKSHHKQGYKLMIRGEKALDIMKDLKPLMGNRRQLKIEECIASYSKKSKAKVSKEDIEAILKKHSEGEKAKIIAETLPISKWRVYQIIRQYKVESSEII